MKKTLVVVGLAELAALFAGCGRFDAVVDVASGESYEQLAEALASTEPLNGKRFSEIVYIFGDTDPRPIDAVEVLCTAKAAVAVVTAEPAAWDGSGAIVIETPVTGNQVLSELATLPGVGFLLPVRGGFDDLQFGTGPSAAATPAETTARPAKRPSPDVAAPATPARDATWPEEPPAPVAETVEPAETVKRIAVVGAGLPESAPEEEVTAAVTGGVAPTWEAMPAWEEPAGESVEAAVVGASAGESAPAPPEWASTEAEADDVVWPSSSASSGPAVASWDAAPPPPPGETRTAASWAPPEPPSWDPPAPPSQPVEASLPSWDAPTSSIGELPLGTEPAGTSETVVPAADLDRAAATLGQLGAVEMPSWFERASEEPDGSMPLPLIAPRIDFGVQRKGGAVLAFTAPKGGTGKSSIAITAALWLSRVLEPEGKRVIYIDGNVEQADSIRRVAGYRGNDYHMISELARAPRIDRGAVDAVITRLPDYPLHVILGEQGVKEADPAVLSPELYRSVVEVLLAEYDYICVDTAAAEYHDEFLNRFALPVAMASGRLIVVLEPDMSTVEHTYDYLHAICEPTFNGGKNFPPDRIFILNNMATKPGGKDEEYVSRALSDWGQVVSIPYIPELAESNNAYAAYDPTPDIEARLAQLFYAATGESALERYLGVARSRRGGLFRRRAATR